MVVFSVTVIVLLIGVLLLIPLGFREGERPGDASLLTVTSSDWPRGVTVELSNPGATPVLIGMSMRRVGFRLRLEGGAYTRLRTRRITRDLLPGRQDMIGVVQANERETFVVPASDDLGARAELVVVLGHTGRLRSVHRLVKLSPLGVPPAPRSARRGYVQA